MNGRLSPSLSILPSAGLKPVSNGMAPTLRLPSPTLKKGGRLCLLFWMAVRPVYHCHFPKKGGPRGWCKVGCWGVLPDNLSCFGVLRPRGPHVAKPPPCTNASPYLPFGHRRPLYWLTPAAKMCVCTANWGLGGVPN